MFRSVFIFAIIAGTPALAQVAPKGPEPATLKANAEMARNLPFADRQDFDDAMKGFVGTVPDALVPGTGQRPPVWSMKPYEFLAASAGDRESEPVAHVAAQRDPRPVRGQRARLPGARLPLSNVTFIEGDTGVIVVDPLQFTEHARAAIDLYCQHRPKSPSSP